MRSFSNNNIQDFQDFFTLVGDFAKVGFAHFDAVTCEGYALSHWYRNVGEKEGRPLTEIINVYEHLHPEDRIILQHFLKEAVEGTSDALKQDVRILHEDRHITWTRINMIVRRRCPEKHIFEMLCINFDITQTKEIEAKLIKAKEQAEEADTLKSAFIANMSHEIRTPLNVILGFSEIMAITDSQEERMKYFELVDRNSDLLLQLISDILDISKLESGSMTFKEEFIDVKELCEEVTNDLKIKNPAGVELIFRPEEAECHIVSDKQRIRQVLTNIIRNAQKFTHSGEIVLGYRMEKDGIEFYIKDTGIGISAENRERIFDRFVKFNNLIPGSGLGLAICKNIVEELGGEIGVESEVGKGSRFWIRMPLKLSRKKKT